MSDYASASYKHQHHKRYAEGLWCIGHIKPVYFGEELHGATLWDTDHRYTHAPSDLDEERAAKETDIIMARLMAV